ncbi:MAG: hypothetical protein GXY84_00830 [Clostridiales bacterium]|mgnify:CR=1 FL=1|nr:hypothetical protein [Clostridiales bacterium]
MKWLERFRQPGQDGRLSGREKFFLALPIPASSLSGVLIHNVYIKLYTDLIGLAPMYVGLVYLIYNIWNFLNDPLIGVLIDRRKVDPKRGKFLHIMRISVPFMILCLVAMLFSQPSWPQWLIFTALLVELFIFDTFSTAYSVAANSLILVAAASKEERVDVNVIQAYVANIVSFVATLVPTFLLVGNREGNLTQVALILLGVVALNAGIYYWALANLQDKPEYYALGNPEGSLNLNTLWADIRPLLRSRTFRTWAGYNLLALAPNAVYFTAFLYLMDHVIKTGGLEATLADVVPMLVVFALLPFMARFIKRAGGKRAILWGSLPYALGHVWLFFTGSWLMVLLAYIPIMAGKYLMSTGGVPLGAALIDENERLTGTRKPGLIGALLALIAAPALSSQLMIFMGILQAFGYDVKAPTQTQQAMLGIRVGTALVPIAFLLLGLIPLLRFPIDRRMEEELSEYSQQRRRGGPLDGRGR